MTTETQREERAALINAIISAYHTTRLRDTPVANHILSKQAVTRAFERLAFATLEDGQKSASRGEGREAIARIIDPEAVLASWREINRSMWIGRWDAALAKADEILATLASPQPTDGWVRIEDAAKVKSLLQNVYDQLTPGAIERADLDGMAFDIATAIRALSPATGREEA